jgi:endothelin-converting enzyme
MLPEVSYAEMIRNRFPQGYSTDRVLVAVPEYMKSLSKLLQTTSPDVLEAFFYWKITQSLVPYINRDLVKPYYKFQAMLSGADPDAKPERWRTCLSYVGSHVGWIISRFYVDKAFSEKSKNEGNQIVLDIKNQYVKLLTDSDWMDKSVVKEAIDKVHNINQKIGFPTKSPNLMDPANIQQWYTLLNVTDDHFSNVLASRFFSEQRDWRSLSKPVDRNEWQMMADDINAYYSPSGNEIVFPAGIMQSPVFNVDFPSYINYGAFGSISGHELSHGFDNSGRHYDQIGNYTDWWDNSTVSNFMTKTQCFIKQYSEYSVEGDDGKPLHVNGKLTQGENMADIGGVRASFAAWKARLVESGIADKTIPGLEAWTHEQLFFLGYGNWWCGKTKDAYQRVLIYSDPHSPNWARILGVAANSMEFQEAFQCPKKQARCKLW